VVRTRQRFRKKRRIESERKYWRKKERKSWEHVDTICRGGWRKKNREEVKMRGLKWGVGSHGAKERER
jgi:hypothetical protein